MADFGLVLFREKATTVKHENVKQKSPVRKLFDRFVELLFKAGFFKLYIGSELYYSFKKAEFKKGLRSIELVENVRAWIIELPFPHKRFFQFNRAFIEKYVNSISIENGIHCSIYPESIRRIGKKDSYYEYEYISKIIMKSLLVLAMESICQKAGLRMVNLDMVIIPGNLDVDLISTIERLEPYINFITVLSSEQLKERYETMLSELFSDTGLSFNISLDYKNTLRNARLIINMGNASELNDYRLHRKSLVINLAETQNVRLQGENVVINGLVFEFVDKSFKNFLFDLRGLYNKKEICDITFASKLEIYKDSIIDDILHEKIQREFDKGNCRIIGFEGHRGIISLEIVAKSIMLQKGNQGGN